MLSVYPLCMPIIATVARKGGVGKSTIIANLATEILALNSSVWVFDTDPQQTLFKEMSLGTGQLSKLVEPLDTNHPELFKRAIKAAQRKAQFILIDTPPAFSDPALLAALLADLILMPCGPSIKDLIATNETLLKMKEAQAEREDGRPLLFFVPNLLNPSSRLSAELPVNLKELGTDVFPGISRRVSIAAAGETGLTVTEYDPNGKARTEFQALTKAVMEALV